MPAKQNAAKLKKQTENIAIYKISHGCLYINLIFDIEPQKYTLIKTLFKLSQYFWFPVTQKNFAFSWTNTFL